MSSSKPIPQLVFVPGLLCNEVLWQPQLQALQDNAECWVADISVSDDMDLIVAAVLDAIPFSRFSLAGLSMGGYIAARIALRAPQRVERLALLNTRAHAQDTNAGRQRRQASMTMAANGGFDQVVEGLLPALLSSAAMGKPDIVDIVKRMSFAIGPEIFIREQRANMNRTDIAAELGRVNCPTWIVGADKDAIAPPASQQALAAAIPDAMLHMVANCGHLSTLEQPTEVNTILERWLDIKLHT